jgi:peroxiredoxin/predicted negative regulator of RcsB-dependent stress response
MISIFLALFLLFAPLAYADAIGLAAGEIAPDFTLSSIEGKSVSLSDVKGKTVVLVYWRTGQNYSAEALKDVNDILKKYRDKGVEVISMVSGDDEPQKVRSSARELGLNFPVLIDKERKVYGDYGVRVYPATVIIGTDGKIAYDIAGHPVTYSVVLDGHLGYVLGEIDKKKLDEMISPRREVRDETAIEAERKYNLAVTFVDEGLIDQAIDTVKKSIEIKSDVAKSHMLLGFLYLEIKDADNALGAFNRALEIDPNSHDAKTGLGGALILKGESDRAIEVLTDAALTDPHPQMTYYKLGRAYELQGKKDKALEMYRKALDKIFKKQILP